MPNPRASSRPKFLNLLKIRMPVMAIASIAHRVSGALLFLATPALIYGLSLSLRSAEDFAAVVVWFGHPAVQLFALLLAWALFHHLFAGIRYLLMDLNVGIELPAGARSAWLVNAAAVVLTVILALILAGAIWR